MARRTINLPDAVEACARRLQRDGESFSAVVTRLIAEGARAVEGPATPTYVGVGEGPDDLGERAEDYLRQLVEAR